MGETVRKAYRLPVELADELALRAEAEGVNATELVRRALGEYLRRAHAEAHTEAHSEAHAEAHADEGAAATIAALTAQLDVKDAQIGRLMDALSQAQETAHAAQVLEGAHMARALTGDVAGDDVAEGTGEGAHGRSGILHRLREWLRS